MTAEENKALMRRYIEEVWHRENAAALDVFRAENGRLVEQWGGPNMLNLLQQLGAEVSPGPE